MRFLQSKKFSYLIRLLFGVEKYENEEVTAKKAIYSRFLKAVLVEHAISVLFLLVTIYQILFHLELEKQADHYKSVQNETAHLKPDENNLFNLIILNKLKRLNGTINDVETRDFVRTKLNSTFVVLKRLYAIKTCTLMLKFELNRTSTVVFSEVHQIDEVFERFGPNASDVNVSIILTYLNKRLNYLYTIDFSFKNFKSTSKLILNYEEINQFSLKNLFLLAVLSLFGVYFLAEELLELIKYKLGYLSYFLNWIDLFVVALLVKHIFESIFIDIKVISVEFIYETIQLKISDYFNNV